MAAWTWLLPLTSLAVLGAGLALGVGTALAVISSIVLFGAVLAAVHHAEVVAHRVGEPFGTLVFALAVTVIEASLILSIMLEGGADAAALPRDTLYAAVLVVCNGVVGACVLAGGIAHHEQTFRVEGAGAGLAALIAMCTLSLVLPSFTTSSPGATYGASQLVFAAVTSAALWTV